uniref:Neurensin-1 n=1 Tax=Cacopsylla melanoneura TaxID=428564 RepID=A0A8D9A537_9HEMI
MSKMKSMFKKVHFCEKTMQEPAAQPIKCKDSLEEHKPSPHGEKFGFHDADGNDLSPTSGCGVMSLFGIKSYLHQFYDKRSIQTCREHSHNILAEPSQEPETYLIERGKRRYSNHYFRAFIILGMLLLSIGLSLLVIGHFHSYQNPIIDVRSNIEIIDRRSLAYNYSLEMYRLIGLAVFCAGGIVIMLTLLVDIYRSEMGDKGNTWEREQEFYIVWE